MAMEAPRTFGAARREDLEAALAAKDAEIERLRGQSSTNFSRAKILSDKLDAAEAEVARLREDKDALIRRLNMVEDLVIDNLGDDLYERLMAAINGRPPDADAIRALALTQPASTQPLTDQGETSTAGEVG